MGRNRVTKVFVTAAAVFVFFGIAARADQQSSPPSSAPSAHKSSPSSAPPGAAPNSNLCAPILQMSSADWVAKYVAEHSSSPADTVEAINAYGRCYESRTNRLAASLNKSGKGPLMGANGNFRDFQAALKAFTTKALADTKPPGDSVRTAYASLYALQFRYVFLQGYLPKAEHNRPLTQEESDEYAKSKNRLGELLGLLDMDKFHEVHAAFSDIINGTAINDLTKLEVYRYAIFILARPGEKPFSPPPF